MKIGFLTACLRGLSLEELVKWARERGFQALEVACWPKISGRDYFASHIDVDKLEAEEIKDLFKSNNLEISSLAYYDNNLDPDLSEREAKHSHLKKVVDAAQKLGVNLVGTFIGRDPGKTIEENFKEVAKVFPDLVIYAREKNVRLMIENCPMQGWQFEGLIGNIAYNPQTWDRLFEILPEVGLNFDPSHLYWQGVDYLDCIGRFKEHIFHTHAKDAEVIDKEYSKNGIFGSNWWRHRIPGLGGINWAEFVSALQENGYDQVLSIEHEDPVWEGSEEKVKKGLILGQRHLSQFIV
ncbi:sugar phosphate isomerase/epimerase [candidate division NPL-UPA2 bacterium]|nr:sugar phosphate isomerase/epimerase [candidate division NPL-UPA2 bacterium]